jgi:ABC-type transport system substrate-binding protein
VHNLEELHKNNSENVCTAGRTDWDLFSIRGSSFLFSIFLGTSVFFAGLFLLIMLSGCGKTDPKRASETVIHHRLREKVQTLDPAEVGDMVTHAVAGDIFECLYDYDYTARPYRLVPLIAAAMPEISEDGTVYRIPVRQDVYFHDNPCFPEGKGRLLTAHDFVYAWKRIANLKNRSKSWWIFDGRVKGLDAFRDYTRDLSPEDVDYDRPVEGLYAENDSTLIIKLVRPWPQLVLWLQYIATAPVAREAVDYYGKRIGYNPVGTGAYRLVRWQRGSFLEGERHPRYFMFAETSDGSEPRRLPYIDRVFWRVIPEDQPRWLLFMRGELDINTIPKDNFGQVISMGTQMTETMIRRNIRLEPFDEPNVFWVGFNMTDSEVGDNPALRKAISFCIDRERFIELFQNGRGKVAHGYIPPMMDSYDPGIAQVSSSQLDMARAREYLKEAERVHGKPFGRLRLAMGGTDTTYRQMGQFIQSNIAQLGLTVEVELFDWPTFLEKLRNGSHQMFFSGWTADYPDVESFMQLYYSKNAPWPNNTMYNNPAFDAIFERIAVMPDSPERTALYQQAQRMVVADLPCAYVFHRIAYILRHDWVENVVPNAYRTDTNGMGLTKFFKVDMDKREAYKKKFR